MKWVVNDYDIAPNYNLINIFIGEIEFYQSYKAVLYENLIIKEIMKIA